MAVLAVYTCPILVRAPGDPGHEAFLSLDGRVAAALLATPPPGLLRVWLPLEPPRAWPAHIGALAGTPKPTLSAWADLSSAYAYSYGPGAHREALRRRREWFALASHPIYVLWYAAAAHAVDHDRAVERLERLGREGPGPDAFDFRHPYDDAGRALDARDLSALRRHDGEGLDVGAPGRRRLPLPLRDQGL